MSDDRLLFQTIRQIAGRGLTQAEVDAVNRALASEVLASQERHASPAAVSLIHEFETCKLTAYPDPGSKDGLPVTIGWGSTSDEYGRPIKLGTTWSMARADARFRQDLAKYEAALNTLLGNAPTTQNQYDALLSFCYNVGPDIDDDDKAEGLGDSTLLKKHLKGDYAGAAREFAKWNKNDGRVMAGLTRRRAAEAALYGRA